LDPILLFVFSNKNIIHHVSLFLFYLLSIYQQNYTRDN